MTAKWICSRCNMLCLGQEHYARHRDGDHSATTSAERKRWVEEQRAYWAAMEEAA